MSAESTNAMPLTTATPADAFVDFFADQVSTEPMGLQAHLQDIAENMRALRVVDDDASADDRRTLRDPHAAVIDDPFSSRQESPEIVSLRNMKLDADTSLATAFAGTARSQLRQSEHLARTREPTATKGDERQSTLFAIADHSLRAFDAYLNGALSVPSMVRLPGLPSLVVDTVAQRYYAKGALCVFEAYCRAYVHEGDWTPLTPMAFRRVIEQHGARDLRQLRWLSAYLRAPRQLTLPLQGVTRFELTQWLDVGSEYRIPQRVIERLQSPATMDELAQASRVPAASLCNVLNSLHAIGILHRCDANKPALGR